MGLRLRAPDSTPQDEWVLPFEPIPIIEVPGLGTLAAKQACAELGVKSAR